MTYCLPLIQIDVSMVGQIAIFSTAMNSTLNLIRQVDQLMCNLNSINMDFSVICVIETWGTSIHIDMQNIIGYKLVHIICIRQAMRFLNCDRVPLC